MWNARRTAWIPDPGLGYWKGRFTNGYNWVDHLRKLWPSLAINNLAFGGAASAGRYKSHFIYIPNLVDQLTTAVHSKLLASNLDTGVVIWIGANDVLDHLDKKHPTAVKDLIMKNVNAVTAQLVGKYKIPANHVFVATLPPMDRVPYYVEKSHRGLAQAASTGIDATNAAIEQLARERGMTAIPAHTFIARWLDGTYRDPYMTNLTAACLPMDPDTAGKRGFNPLVSHKPKINACKSTTNAFAMFFDTMHPTAVAHCGLSILFKRYFQGGSLSGIDTTYCRTAKMSDVLPSPAASKLPCMRSVCSRSIMTMSTSSSPRCMSWNTSTPKPSMPAGRSVIGATTRTRAPMARSRTMLERATRLCRMSPQIATVRPSIRPLRRRMVSASSSAWVGCSWAPSPALMTAQRT